MQTHFITKDGNQLGPYSINEITDKIAAGELTGEDLYWIEGMTEWEPLGKTFATPAATAPPPPPSKTNTVQSSPASSGLAAALQNLGGALLVLVKMLCNKIKSAAQSDKAQQVKKTVVEKSFELRKRAEEMASAAASSEAVRASVEKINMGAASIREKAHGSRASDGSDITSATPRPPSPAPAQNQVNVAQATEKRRTRINWIPALVLFSIASAILVIVDCFAINSDDKAVYSFSIFAIPFLLLSVFLFSKLHYFCWKALPEDFRATTPGKAVGFMFIPFYNFYWAFVTWPQLSEGLSKWQQSTGKDAPGSKGLGITFAILFVCLCTIGLIPALGLMIKIAMLVIFILFYRKTVSGINHMLDSDSECRFSYPVSKWTLKRIAIASAVILPIHIILVGVAEDNYDEPSHQSRSSLPSWYTEVQGVKTLPCLTCNGAGVRTEPCRSCYGSGTSRVGNSLSGEYVIVCPSCNGRKKETRTCYICGGSGQKSR